MNQLMDVKKNLLLIFLLLIAIPAFPENDSKIASYNELRVHQADLKQYPDHILSVLPDEELTIGDLHGNALKLIYFLVNTGVMELSESDYAALETIYHTPVNQLKAQDIAQFESIIFNAKTNAHARLRFIGDNLCDRGSNDYFTLQIFKKLSLAHVDFEILLSNHDKFFITALERPAQSFNYNPYGEGSNESFVQSMLNLQTLIDHKLTNKDDLIETIYHHYLNHIKAIAYTLNQNKKQLTLYTHAPIDLRIVQKLANQLDLNYDDVSLFQLRNTFERINAKISDWLIRGQFSIHYAELEATARERKIESPLTQLIWNRDYHRLNRLPHDRIKTFGLIYVHGHDSRSHIINLDDTFGKNIQNTQGSYSIYLTRAET